MTFGLVQEDIININLIFAKHDEIDKVIIYGSRANGKYRNGSDIDLTIVGKDISLNEVLRIELEIDDLFLPYKFDLSRLHKINNEDLIDHIKRIGIVFYDKKHFSIPNS